MRCDAPDGLLVGCSGVGCAEAGAGSKAVWGVGEGREKEKAVAGES